MEDLSPKFSVTPLIEGREVHWTIQGLFDEEHTRELQKALFKASEPLIADGKGFRVMADMRKFAVQPRHIAEIMEQTQIGSAKIGVYKMAVIHSSMLVKQQLRRVSKSMEIDFFEDEATALAWLRADGARAA